MREVRTLHAQLQAAMDAAGIGPSRLAVKVGVDPDTVRAWLADPARTPRPRTRQQVSQALGVSVESLWPKSIRTAVKTGYDREMVAIYPYRNACPSSVWTELIDSASHTIVLGGYTNYFLWQEQPRLTERLRQKCEKGCRVRVLLGIPDSEVTVQREANEGVPLTISTRIRITLDALRKLGEAPHLEVRYSEGHLGMSTFIFDEHMLVTPHLTGMLGHDSPMLHLRRLGPDGVFERFAQHTETLWENAMDRSPGLPS